ncbi:hypothetical protein V8G54_017173 [Vigna mungo]|uniref:DNA-3-methyladenine glycosylase I n=1 Tax=Vigna mungo TaxID=3915 RepID=A0AAQ3NPA0_VIGMU
MSKTNVRRHGVEKCRSVKETHNFFSRNLKKVYPIGLQKSTSSLSLSSISLSLSQNSNDSSQADSLTPLDEKISLALRLISPRHTREPTIDSKPLHQHQSPTSPSTTETGHFRRCNWITKNSDNAYIEFHDECWGVPAYDDNKLFELLAMSGLLMDYNWTEILKRKETLREVFAGFDANTVAKMEEKEIMEIASNKALSLADSRVMCIVDNAKCITKAKILSKDLVKRGFRFVGPVIVHSFMQAAGLTIDHLLDCYRHNECVSLAERPWRHI